MKTLSKFLAALILVLSTQVYADSITIPMYLTATGNEPGDFVGSVVATDTQYGLLLTPSLHGLTPAIATGMHGFHVHTNPSCADNGMAAGGHLDPYHTNHHYGPYNPKGHLGDLPAIYVDQNGNATFPVLAPRLKVKDILGHSLMVHSGGDNYSDTPAALGGGGARMACGIIPQQSN